MMKNSASNLAIRTAALDEMVRGWRSVFWKPDEFADQLERATISEAINNADIPLPARDRDGEYKKLKNRHFSTAQELFNEWGLECFQSVQDCPLCNGDQNASSEPA